MSGHEDEHRWRPWFADQEGDRASDHGNSHGSRLAKEAAITRQQFLSHLNAVPMQAGETVIVDWEVEGLTCSLLVTHHTVTLSCEGTVEWREKIASIPFQGWDPPHHALRAIWMPW